MSESSTDLVTEISTIVSAVRGCGRSIIVLRSGFECTPEEVIRIAATLDGVEAAVLPDGSVEILFPAEE